MKKSLKGIALCLATAFSCLAAIPAFAGCKGKQDEVVQPPETGYSDKTDLVYGSAIDGYKKTDFTAHWIWTQYSPEDSYVAFRKTFTLDSAQTATAYISAESKYFMWVNGELTVYDGSPKRGPTPYDSYFDTVEIKNLSAGENTLAFLVPYNGRSGDSSIDGAQSLGEGDTQGGLLFEMSAGGKTVKSDSTWKVKQLDEYKSRRTLGSQYPSYPQSSMLAERNIYYDARESSGDFTAKEYDDSSWDNATPVAKPGALPFGDLYKSVTPLTKFGEITTGTGAEDIIGKELAADTTVKIKLPKNMQYSPYFELTAPAGKKITYYSDTYQIGTTSGYTFKDTYITRNGEQIFESYPWRSGSEIIIEAEAGINFTKIGYRPSGYNTEQAGGFESSDEELNKLWQMCANTVDICMRDTYMDCPDRERGPYMGDATNQVDAAYYAFSPSAQLLTKKMILSAIAWTGKDGLIPSRAPSTKPHEIPVQSLAFSTAVYNYYLQSGDAETVKAYYEVLINYLKVWKMRDNGMPEIRNGEWTWTDWGTGADLELIQVLWYYYSLTVAENMASEFGKNADVAFLGERKKSISDNFDALYKKSDGYRSGNKADDRANALAVITGLAKASDYALVKGVLDTVYNASPYMERFVLQALCKMGEYEAALNRIKTRYGAMIDSDDTTVWELFSRDSGTNNHGWSAGPMLVASADFMGIRPTSAGYADYEIKPENLFEKAACKVSTAKGEISVSYKKEASGTSFKLKTVEGNCTLKIPVSFGSTVSGTGITVTEVKDGYHVIKLSKAGEYNLTVS